MSAERRDYFGLTFKARVDKRVVQNFNNGKPYANMQQPKNLF